jgi:hypothetical protein
MALGKRNTRSGVFYRRDLPKDRGIRYLIVYLINKPGYFLGSGSGGEASEGKTCKIKLLIA